MQIKSKFKDYYDYLAYIYGADPLITYSRRDITAQTNKADPVKGFGFVPKHQRRFSATTEWYYPDLQVTFDTRISYNYTAGHSNYYTMKSRPIFGPRILVICGRAYDLINIEYEPHKYRLEVFDPDKHGFDKDRLPMYIKTEGGYGSPSKNKDKYKPRPDLHQSSYLIELSRKIGHPVFFINSEVETKDGAHWTVTIDGECPILSNLGVAHWYPADQLYQDISYFISNQMQDSPDTMPSPNPGQTDREKIISHGMDPKISFRHRK